MQTEELLVKVKADTAEATSKLNGLKGLAGGAMVLGGISYLKESVAAYAEASTIQAELVAQAKNQFNTLKDVGSTQAKIVEHIDAQSSALSKKSTYDDDDIKRGLTNLSTFQLTGKQIDSLGNGVNDLVAHQKGLNATSDDFLNTTNLIGKTISTGQFASLKKVGLTVDENTAKQMKHASQAERTAYMAKILKDNYGGTAQALANTDAGKLKQMEVRFGNIQEAIGEKLLPYVLKLATFLEKNLDTVIKFGAAFAVIKIGGAVIGSIQKAVGLYKQMAIYAAASKIAEPKGTGAAGAAGKGAAAAEAAGKVGKAASLAGKVGKAAVKGAGVVGGAYGVYEAGKEGGWGGALQGGASGAAAGATIGSAFPVVGTATGAVIGGIGGALWGGKDMIAHSLHLDGKEVASNTSAHGKKVGGNTQVQR